jgi:hypothetical protein
MSTVHAATIGVRIAGGLAALATGTVAAAARNGGTIHARAGTFFCAAMLVLGVTAALLEPFRTPPGSPVGGIMVCYFVATAWSAALTGRSGAGRFEKVACALAPGAAVLIIGAGIQAAWAPTGRIPGPGAILAVGAFCLLAGLLD